MKNRMLFQWVACILVGGAFGLVSIFPAIAVRFDPSFRFRGIEMQATDAEPHYAARVNEIRDGFWKTANVFYSDDKFQPYLQPPLPELVISHLGSLVGLDAARALILSQFFFGAGVFVVMVGCFFAITGLFWWSFTGVALALLTGHLFSTPLLLPKLFDGTTGVLEFLNFARPVNPQWSAMLFFGSLWGLGVWTNTRSKHALLAVGLLMGLAFYSYVYTWALIGTICILMLIFYAGKRQWSRVCDLICLGGGVIIMAAPYFFNLWQAIHHPFYNETAIRFGLVETRKPLLGIFATAFLLLAWVGKKLVGDRVVIISAFAFAVVIVLNQQVITGRSIVPSHYHWYFVRPAVIILGTVLIGHWIISRNWFQEGVKKYVFATGIVICAAAFFVGGLFQFRSYQEARHFWSEQQAAAPALEYLREHLHQGDVVYAQGFIRDLIPIYTTADVYWATNAYMYLSSDERARNAYFVDLWLAGVTYEEAAQTFFASRRLQLSLRIHAIYAREALGAADDISDQEVQAHLHAYQDFLSLPNQKKISLYPLHYLLISSSDPPTTALVWLRSVSSSIYRDADFDVRKMALVAIRD